MADMTMSSQKTFYLWHKSTLMDVQNYQSLDHGKLIHNHTLKFQNLKFSQRRGCPRYVKICLDNLPIRIVFYRWIY